VFLDSDDALAPTCLQRRVEVMESNPNVDFAVFPTWVFHAIPGDSRLFWNQFTSENDLDRFLRFDSPWHTSGPIWKKMSLRQKGPWDDRALCPQDWEFHIRAIAAGLSYIKLLPTFRSEIVDMSHCDFSLVVHLFFSRCGLLTKPKSIDDWRANRIQTLTNDYTTTHYWQAAR
jgi:hypothetical protein